MRHGRKVNKLSRTSSHRKAMLANMAVSLIKHKRINTTVPKAKSLRTFVEPLLTKSKNNTTHSRRVVFNYLQDKDVIKELFGPVAEKIASRPGGYTRILRTGYRSGDNAEMCLMELVDFNENLSGKEKTSTAATTEKKTTRRGRGKTAKKEETSAPEVKKEEEK